jgi:hypothetical protein
MNHQTVCAADWFTWASRRRVAVRQRVTNMTADDVGPLTEGRGSGDRESG